MSKMTDMWGDMILIDAEPGIVSITFTERLPHTIEGDSWERSASMDLDAAQTLKLVKKLMRALDDMEDM